MKEVKPLADWVLAKVTDKKVSGLVLPDSANADSGYKEVRVIDKGDKVTRVQPGDLIKHLPQYAVALSFPDIEPDLILIKEEGIVAVLKGE